MIHHHAARKSFNFKMAPVQIPFSLIALLDAVKKKQIPADLKCRQVRSSLLHQLSCQVAKLTLVLIRLVFVQVFPTNGTKSSSLWDAPDVASLQEWLDEFLEAECNSEVFQVFDLQAPFIFC